MDALQADASMLLRSLGREGDVRRVVTLPS
jgi:hypothetical protein